MKWPFRLFSGEQKVTGVYLSDSTFWEITAPNSFVDFLRLLPDILPDSCILYIEGCGMDSEIKAFLDARQVSPSLNIAKGTMLPKPDVFHLPLSRDNLRSLADLCESHAVPEVCTHLHVYRGDSVLLQWYDASSGDPFLLSKQVPEIKIRAFCDSLGCSYKEGSR